MGVRSRVPGAARIRVGASLMSITKQKILTIVVISAGIGALTSVAGYSLGLSGAVTGGVTGAICGVIAMFVLLR